jgi:hypothetical protein
MISGGASALRVKATMKPADLHDSIWVWAMDARLWRDSIDWRPQCGVVGLREWAVLGQPTEG